MRATVDSTALREALGDVKPAVSTQRPFVQLEVGDDLAVRADDLDVGISTSLAVEGRSKAGKVLVPHGPLTAFLSKADAEHVELSLDDGMLAVQDNAASLSLAVVADNWFPKREPVAGDGVPLDADAWGRVRGMIQFCSPDAARAPLNGVLFAADDAVATDTYQLAAVTHPFGVDHVVPVSILKAVPSDATTVSVRAGGKAVEVVAGALRVSTSKLVGDFPPWRKLMREYHVASVTCSAPALSRAIDRAAVLARESPSRLGKQVRLYLADGAMVVESIPDTEKGDSRSIVTEVIECEVEGTWDWRFGVATGPMGCLNAVLGKPEEVTLDLGGPGHPIMVNTDTTFVMIQPVNL